MRVLLPLILLAQAAQAQVPPGIYPEPVPRVRGVAVPADALAAAAVGAPELGIPSASDFLADHLTVVRRTGEHPLLVLLAGFADSEEPTVDPAELQRLLFDGPAPRGTLPEFYHEASRGVFSVRGTVTPWVRTTVPILDAAGEREGHGWIGDRMRDFVTQAIRLADPSLDFGQFDDDGPDGIPNSGDDDGWVDGVAVKYFEVSGACGGPAPWPHFGAARDSLGNPVETEDRTPSGAPIRVQVYIADSALDCTGEELDGAEVLAHEFGHLIGLPDLYRLYDGSERENRSWTVGCFDLMAAGAWGCGTGPKVPHFGPTLLSPMMKARLGWIEMIDVEHADHQEFVLEPARDAPTALRVRLAPGSTEWFIFEYRQRAGFDLDLPAEGIVVYHWDELQGARPTPPGTPPAYGYHVVEADGNFGLRRSEVTGGNRGEAGDVFARDGSVSSIDDASSPSTRDHLGGSSTVTVHSMRVDGDVARVTISAGTGMHVAARELPESPVATFPYDGRLRLSGGTAPYTATRVAGALPPGMSATMENDVLRLTGEPLAAGSFVASFLVEDATGRALGEAVKVDVQDLPLSPVELLRGVDTTLFDARIRDYLDRSGNGNGSFDVGDIRMYLIRTRQLR